MSEAAAAPAAPPKQRRWLKVALIASLALNALVIGVVLRSMWQFRASYMMSPAGIEAGLPAFVDTLPRERRDALRVEGLVDRQRQLRPLRVDLRRARADAARAFLAEPFDRQAYVAAQAAVLEAEVKLRRTAQAVLPDLAQRMTAEERRSFVGWRGRWRGGPGRDGAGRDGAGRGPRGGGPEPEPPK